jgi:lysophospholipase L1-like esterase
MSTTTIFNRYVALGDSTSEGIDDPYPGASLPAGPYRGWADRLADRLALDNPQLEYANLAIRGRKIAAIREEQLAPALAMQPDLISVVGGTNDLLRPKFDLRLTVDHVEAIVAACRDRAITVLMMTLPDLSASMRIARIVSDRLAAFNEALREVAARNGAVLADMAAELTTYDARAWSPDRLHANDVGHQYLMWGAAKSLELPDGEAGLDQLKATAIAAEQLSLFKGFAAETAWLWQFLRPWVMRRIKGTSSGDGVSAKRPDPLRVIQPQQSNSKM